MQYTYYINDFIENSENYWCRCSVNKRFGYIIISDSMFVILHMYKENKQKGKIKFYTQLDKLKEIITDNIKELKIILLWIEDPLFKDCEYKHEIVFESDFDMKLFIKNLNTKKNKLLSCFSKFDNDEIRNSPDSIVRMVNYYEKILTQLQEKEDENNNKIHHSNICNGSTDRTKVKNMLIIYYMKSQKIYSLDKKIKKKYGKRLKELIEIEEI